MLGCPRNPDTEGTVSPVLAACASCGTDVGECPYLRGQSKAREEHCYRDSCWGIDGLERAWWRSPRWLVHIDIPGDGERAELIQLYEEKAKERSSFCLQLPYGT